MGVYFYTSNIKIAIPLTRSELAIESEKIMEMYLKLDLI